MLDKFTGETPSDYYTRFKWVLNAACSDGYFQKNPTEDVAAKSNPSISLKENLEVDEYLSLIDIPCLNEEVKSAFMFSCYPGLRWVDVKGLKWSDIKDAILTTRIIQAKTGRQVCLTLHPIAQSILKNQKLKTGECDQMFILPTADGANKVLASWMHSAGITKHITWSCARLGFSILLQDRNVDNAKVAYLMGHISTEQVRKTHKRHRPKNEMETIGKLPSPDVLPHFFRTAG